MFNRYLYQKLQTQVQGRDKVTKLQKKFNEKRRSTLGIKADKMQHEVNKYKAKVRNFLVELASNPIELGQYIPPINNIQRVINTDHRLGAPQMFINGFKTNKDRLKRIEEQNKIIDHSPMKSNLKDQSFRQRSLNKEIQPTLRFAENRSLILQNKSRSKFSQGQSSNIVKGSQSVKNLRLPMISPNPQKKTYFKAIEQMGNQLKMMEQTESERIGLENRLMVVMDGKQAHVKQTAFDLLVKCKLLKKRVNSQRSLHTLKASSVKL